MSSPGRGTAYLLVAQGVLLVTGFAVSVMLARGLGPAGFGVYGVVMSVLGWLERTLNAGVPGAAAALLSQEGKLSASVERSARLLLLCWSLPLFVFFWSGAGLMAAYFGLPEYTWAFRIAAVNIPAMALFYAYEGVLKGRRHFAAVSGLQTLQSVAKFLGVVALLAVGFSVNNAFIVHVAATVLAVAVAMLLWPLRGEAPNRAAVVQILRGALPLTGYAVALVVLMNLSLWQLQHSSAAASTATGHFVASMNMTKILMVVPATTSGVLFVSLSWALANDKPELVRKYVEQAGRFALLTLLPACAVLAVDAEPVMRLLFGPEYAGSGPILVALAVAFAAVALLDIYFYVLQARGLRARALAVALLAIPAMALLNHWWIARAGAEGAALAAATVLVVAAAVQALQVRLAFGLLVPLAMVLRLLVASALTGALAWLWPATGLMLLPKFAVLGVFYLAALFALRELRAHDLQPFAFWKADKKAGT